MNNEVYPEGDRPYPPWQVTSPRRPRSRAAAPRAAYCVWVNGELIPYEEVTVHLSRRAMHFAPGVFEGIRCYQTKRGPAIFRLRDHLQHFLDSVQALGIDDLRYDLHDLQWAANVTVHANNFRSCYIRPVLYSGDAEEEARQGTEPVVAVAAWEWPALRPTGKVGEGMRVTVSSFYRMPSTAGLSGEFSGEYANFVQARATARRAGFDEVIMFNPEGRVAATTGESVFVVKDGVIYTSPGGSSLEAITRDTVITLAGDLGYEMVEASLSREQLDRADEVFVCGTAAEVVPVTEIDFRPVGGPPGKGKPGPVTRALQSLYFDTVRGRGGQEHGWLEYVMMEPLY